MKVGLLMDGTLPPGGTAQQRFADAIEEVLLAEELGFDFYGLSEVHFNKLFTLSAPEVVLGMLAGRTDRIRLRSVSVVLLPFNHPIRVAERIATLDALSGGRIEVGTARSNNLDTMEAFGIAPADTREMFWDSLDVIQKGALPGELRARRARLEGAGTHPLPKAHPKASSPDHGRLHEPRYAPSRRRARHRRHER